MTTSNKFAIFYRVAIDQSHSNLIFNKKKMFGYESRMISFVSNYSFVIQKLYIALACYIQYIGENLSEMFFKYYSR